jgi:hypothetical protein
MNEVLFKTLILIRCIFPPIIFSVFHPFIAMMLDEFVLDGLISPHHFFIGSIPEHIKGRHKLKYDLFLDSWGFLTGLLPVLYKGHKFYYVFEKYRILILYLFIWKIIGSILVYKYKDYRFTLVFQNFFLAVYLSVGFCDYFNIDSLLRGRIMAMFIVMFILREFYLVNVNKTL